MGPRDEVEPNVPAIQRGRGVETIASMAAAAQACRIPERPIHEIQASVEQSAKLLVSIDPDRARYSFPLGGKTIVGLATDLAEAVAWECGCMTGATLEREDDQFWHFNAYILNLKTGSMKTRPFSQRKSKPGGKFVGDYWISAKGKKWEKDRALELQYAIGASKATRNVIEKGLPFFCHHALQCAMNAISGKRTPKPHTGPTGQEPDGPVGESWESLKARADTLEITEAKIAVFFRKAAKDFDERELLIIGDTLGAVKHGELSAADAFAPEPGENGGVK